tara:strand:+ start:1047 stop:1196 length:150 start_codon:yes stop_codon:yes gene_type:complete
MVRQHLWNPQHDATPYAHNYVAGEVADDTKDNTNDYHIPIEVSKLSHDS